MESVNVDKRFHSPEEPSQLADEVVRLRRTVRDLVALSALPSIWVDSDLGRSLQNLTDVLRAALRAERVCVRAELPNGTRFETGSVNGLRNGRGPALETTQALNAVENQSGLVEIPKLNGSGPLSALPHPIYFSGRQIGFFAACYKADISSADNYSLILQLAANQVTLLFQRHKDQEERLARKLAEERLRATEYHYQKVFQSLPAAVYTCDNEGRITFYNEAAAELWGRRPKIGEDKWCGSWKIFKTDGSPLPLDECPMAISIREGRPVRGQEIIVERLDGTRTFVLPHPDPIRDESGKIVGTVNMLVALDDLKRTEQALRTSEARTRSLLTLMPAAVYACDAEGRITFYNRRAAQLWGREPKLNDDHQKFCAAYKCWFNGQVLTPDETPMGIAVREGKSFRDLEPLFERPDGVKLSVLVNIDPLFDAEGKSAGAINVFQDITALKHIESELRRKTDQLAAIVEHSDDAIFSTDLHGIITSWNQGAQQLYGYMADEVIGQPITILIPEGREIEESAILQRIREGHTVRNQETLRRRKDGSLFDVSLTVSPVRDATGNVIGVSKIARDITEKVRAKEKLEQTVAERTASLREAIAQMEEFSYTVSHDLRAPLRGMQGYAKALLEDFSEAVPPEAAHYLKRIAENANQLDRMSLDVLTFSRLARAELHLERVALDRLVRRIMEEYPGICASKANIEIEPLADVWGHEPSLTQAISNLLNNALKFVPSGVQARVRIWSECRNGQVRLWIADNGIGIPPRYQHRLFSMFERVHPELPYDGTGVGLAIVRKAVERMGGRVGMESDGVNGSRFWIDLQNAQEAK